MANNIVLTTAEDIVAVVDAVVAKGSQCKKTFIEEFTGIATDDQVSKAISMAMDLQLIEYDSGSDAYLLKSYLVRKLVTATTDSHKAVIMRLILEQYEPYITFKTRYGFTKSIELACKQVKILYSMTSNERDIKNTLISIATYAKALKSEGAGLYSFSEDSADLTLLNAVLAQQSISAATLQAFWGEALFSAIDYANVFSPLCDSLQKVQAIPIDARAIVVYAANAFESYLDGFARSKNVSLVGKNGIIQKRDALNAYISKKHRGMIDFIGQVRNAADHGADPDENNQMWSVTSETASIYPLVVASVIKGIYHRDNGNIEV